MHKFFTISFLFTKPPPSVRRPLCFAAVLPFILFFIILDTAERTRQSNSAVGSLCRLNMKHSYIFDRSVPYISRGVDYFHAIFNHGRFYIPFFFELRRFIENLKETCKTYPYTDWSKMRDGTRKFAAEFLGSYATTCVEENWTSLKLFISQSMASHIPSKTTSRRHNLPWLSSETKRRCRNEAPDVQKGKEKRKSSCHGCL